MKKFAATMLTTTILSCAFSNVAFAEKILRFGHDNKADIFENPAHAFTGVFKSIVETETNGEIKVQVYPSNQLGSAKEHIQLVRDGQLQATLSSVGAVASYYPRIGVLDIPFAFDSNESTYKVLDGKFGQTLASDIESELGDVRVLGFPDTGGFFSFTNSKKQINNLEDFEGLRIRTMTLPTHQALVKSLGAEAYPLSWGEVYSSLQTGVIDGQMNPLPTILFAKFNEVQKYVTLTNHLFAPYTFMVNKDFYDGLTDKEKKVIHDATRIALSANRGLSRLIEASDDRGLAGINKVMDVKALSPEARQQMKEATQPKVEAVIKESLGDKGVELMNLFKEEVGKANSDTAYFE